MPEHVFRPRSARIARRRYADATYPRAQIGCRRFVERCVRSSAVSANKKPPKIGSFLNGGQGGIRTHGALAGSPHFECGAIDHSTTCPPAEILERATEGKVFARCAFQAGGARKIELAHVPNGSMFGEQTGLMDQP